MVVMVVRTVQRNTLAPINTVGCGWQGEETALNRPSWLGDLRPETNETDWGGKVGGKGRHRSRALCRAFVFHLTPRTLPNFAFGDVPLAFFGKRLERLRLLEVQNVRASAVSIARPSGTSPCCRSCPWCIRALAGLTRLWRERDSFLFAL